MKPPPHVTTALLIALVVVWVAFFGYGFGSGSLAVATSPTTCTNPPTCYSVTQGLEGAYWGDGFSVQVNIESVNVSGEPFVTSMLETGQSVPVTFGANIYSSGDCGHTGRPTFDNQVGADTAVWKISLGGQSFSGTLDGTAFPPVTTYEFTETTSAMDGYCTVDTATGSDFVAGWYQGGQEESFANLYAIHTLVLDGVYDSSTLSISLSITGTYCDGISGYISGTACAIVSPEINDGAFPNGAWTVTATTTTASLSGYASVENDNAGQLAYNGGPLTVSASTGYEGSAGYQLTVDFPSARGGGVDTAFAAQTVPSDDANYQHTWTVPAGTSQNSSTTGWNNFLIVLTGNFYVQGTAQAGVDISPAYAPGTPVINGASNGPFIQPEQGNTETITVTSTASGSSGTPTQILLWVYYLQAGESASSQPTCGSDWVTTGCNGGEAIPLSTSGTTATGTYSFTVNAPTGLTEIGVQAQAANANTQQVSQISTYLINIVASGTTCGSAGAPTCSTANDWTYVGPALLSAGILLAVVLGVLYMPAGATRYVVIIVTVAGIIVLYVLNWGGAFDVGGILNSGGLA